MKNRTRAIGLIVALIFFLASLAPYTVVGESWGMVWYLFNLPLAEWLKAPLWRYGLSVYVIVVASINSIAVFGAVWCIGWGIGKLRSRAR